jgi:hypothetical protein
VKVSQRVRGARAAHKRWPREVDMLGFWVIATMILLRLVLPLTATVLLSSLIRKWLA